MFASLSLHSVEGKLLEEATAPLVEALGEKRHFHLSKFTLYVYCPVCSLLCSQTQPTNRQSTSTGEDHA